MRTSQIDDIVENASEQVPLHAGEPLLLSVPTAAYYF